MESPEAVAKIRDRDKRLRAAAALTREAARKAKAARSLRDMATMIAHLDDGVEPIVMYRDVLGLSRGLFNRTIQRAPDDAARQKIRADGLVGDDPLETARTAAVDTRRYAGIMREARKIRDDTALAMINGVGDDGERVQPVSNADIARATGLSTARVAQLRTGTR